MTGERQEVALTATTRLRLAVLWDAVKRFGSQKAAAFELGVGQQDLSAWLNLRSTPSLQRLESKSFQFAIFKLTDQLVGDIWPASLREKIRSRRAAGQKHAPVMEIEATREVPISALLFSDQEEMLALPPPQDDHMRREDVKRLMVESLSKLKPKHRFVLERRFGIGRPQLTLEEIGAEMGLSRGRIQQIESKALMQLFRRDGPGQRLRALLE